jgi:hypothetical protein
MLRRKTISFRLRVRPINMANFGQHEIMLMFFFLYNIWEDGQSRSRSPSRSRKKIDQIRSTA